MTKEAFIEIMNELRSMIYYNDNFHSELKQVFGSIGPREYDLSRTMDKVSGLFHDENNFVSWFFYDRPVTNEDEPNVAYNGKKFTVNTLEQLYELLEYIYRSSNV